MSKGAKQLLDIIRKIYSNQRVILEYCIGERLYVDIYLPSLGIGAEFDGKQHSRFIEHFHKNEGGFTASKKRDMRKQELCAEKGIKLLTITYDEQLDEKYIRAKILDLLNHD